MVNYAMALALSMALSQIPGAPPSENVSSGSGIGAFGSGEPLYPWDAHEPWVHGHFQQIPAYGGYHSFRPYNYRHVFSQSQVAAGWGMPANMPYSQGFFRVREYSSQEHYRYTQASSNYAAEAGRLQYLIEQDRLRAARGSDPRARFDQEGPGAMDRGEVYYGPGPSSTIQPTGNTRFRR